MAVYSITVKPATNGFVVEAVTNEDESWMGSTSTSIMIASNLAKVNKIIKRVVQESKREEVVNNG